jgi:phosphonate transport system substrate-binding protein
MQRRIFISLLAALAAGSQSAFAQDARRTLRVTAIPDESPTELQRKFQPLGQYLGKATGLDVQFVPTTDYAATVEALVARKVDLAWFGGFTFVQARHRSGGKVVPLVQRVEDQKFRSVFITPVDSGIVSLADLKGKTIAFGSAASTSGHLMPRHFLIEAGIDPDRDLRRVSFSGAHDATALSVAGGRVDAGALNASVWEKLVAEGRVDASRVRVFFTTPGYFDYNWTTHDGLPASLQKRIAQAFLDLDPRDPEHRKILDLQRTTRFVPTESSNYDTIEKVARSAGLLK